MTSEIRSNTLKNRVGLGTVSFTNTGPIVSGIVTANSFSGPTSGTTGTFSGNVDIGGDLDVDGHTNLDNVSVAGVSTFSGAVTANSTLQVVDELSISDTIVHSGDGNTKIRFPDADTFSVETAGSERLRIASGVSTFAGNVDANGDLDVDGHTNLDNVSIAGVTTSSNKVQVNSLGVGIVPIDHHHIHIESANPRILIRSTGTNAAKILFGDNSSNDSGVIEYSHSSNTMIFNTGNSPRLRIDSSGRLLIPNISSRAIGNVTAKVQLEGTSADGSAISITRNSANASPPYLNFGKSRATSTGGTTIIQNGDSLGEIRFSGADGNDLTNHAASINVEVDGTPGNNDTPGRLIFSTTSDGSSDATERLRITSTGYVQTKSELWVGGSAPVLRWRDSTHGEKATARIDGSDLYFEVANNERLRIDSSGRVLIGTDNADSIGTIASHLVVGSKTNNDEVALTLNVMEGTNGRRVKFFLDDDDGVFGVDSTASTGVAPFVVRMGESEKLRITSGGLVYVNRDGVGGRIDATAGDASIKIGDGNGRQTFKIATMASGQSAAHAFDANGDLNLNTSTNQYGYRLNIQDSAIIYAQTASSGGLEAKWHLDNSAQLMEFGTVTTDNLALITNNVPRLRIDSDGDISIGSATNPGSNRLQIVDSHTEAYVNSSDSIFRIINENTSADTNQASISFTCSTTGSGADSAIVSQAENSSGNSNLQFWTDTSNGMSEKLRISANGHVTPGSNNTQDLGSTAKGWRNIYTNDLNLSNMNGEINDIDGTQGSWTIQEGKDDLYIINRLNGKKFKIKMEEIS